MVTIRFFSVFFYRQGFIDQNSRHFIMETFYYLGVNHENPLKIYIAVYNIHHDEETMMQVLTMLLDVFES